MSDRVNVHQNCPSVWLCALHRGGSDNNNNLKACLDIVSEPLSLPPLGVHSVADALTFLAFVRMPWQAPTGFYPFARQLERWSLSL